MTQNKVFLIIKKLIPSKIKKIIKKIIFGNVEEVDLIFNLIKEKKGIMLDVGAHYGSSLEPFINYDWDVHAFEPSDKNRYYLNKEYSNKKKLHIYPVGVSDKTMSAVNFYEAEVSSGISTIGKFHPQHKVTQKINLISLTDFIEEKKLLKIDFLKIDTEGYDFFVLKGVPWKLIRPSVILCEFEDKKTQVHGYSYLDMYNYLLSKNYIVLMSEWDPIEEYGKTHKWNRLVKCPAETLSKNSWGNFIAFDANEYNDAILSDFIKTFN